MKLSRVFRFAFALLCTILFVGFAKFATVAAQSDAPAQGESFMPLQLSPVDQIAAEDATSSHLHLHLQRSLAANRFAPHENRQNHATPPNSSVDSESAASTAFSVPGVPTPGFYPADLSNLFDGKVLASVQSNNIYVNCSASCWGTPSIFLAHLALSNFIHITDEYAHTTANNRYTVGAATYIKEPLPATLTQTNILQLVHVAARAHGSGYDHVYHVFLAKGVDVCLSATQCYSPNNTSTFVFCAYHGSADFKDIGHVLYTVQPYQNVQGCSVAQPSSNGPVVDSTSSTLSHELIETITDPDGDAWIARKSLIDFGAEIGDLCQTPFGNYAAFTLSGKSYAIQPEYSNKFHACATTP
jgi:hypothetical protein